MSGINLIKNLDYNSDNNPHTKMAATPTGNGNIGVIEEGKVLDAYLSTMEDKKLAKSITKFMHNFTAKAKLVHKNIPAKHRDMILFAMRTHYQLEYKYGFGSQIEKKPFTLGMGYIKRITSPQFAPTTKSQLSILRKKNIS
jgi:hypothetical protein